MTAAVEEAYKNQKMVGKFPACVIHLTARPGEVDVNVHPAKTEVKFQREQAVFTTVYYAVLSALDRDHTRPQASIPGVRPSDTVTPNQTSLTLRDGAGALAGTQFMPAARFKPVGGAAPAPQPAQTPPAPPSTAAPAPQSAGTASPPPERKKSPFQWVEPLPERRGEAPAPIPAGADRPAPAPEQPPPAPEPQQPAPAEKSVPAPSPAPEEEPWFVRGELFHTYVVVEQGDRALLIDKHAAHERANFDRLKAEDYRPMAQELLTPVTFSPPPEDRAALLEQAGLLARFGFEIEEFGSSALAVRSAPDYLDAGDIEGALCQLSRRLRLTGGADPAAARDELLHTMACKAAIKGGWRSGAEELEEVARMVMSGAVKYCPHGRPVAIELTKKQLEKQFRRA